ncbi:hypothetical protein [Rheinheimera sp.]
MNTTQHQAGRHYKVDGKLVTEAEYLAYKAKLAAKPQKAKDAIKETE